MEIDTKEKDKGDHYCGLSNSQCGLHKQNKRPSSGSYGPCVTLLENERACGMNMRREKGAKK